MGLGQSQRNRYVYLFQDGSLPGSRIDYDEEAGRLDLNSVVQAQVGWMADQFIQARFEVTQVLEDGTEEPVYDHPLLSLLDPMPDPESDDRNESGADLWIDALWDFVIHGNAYWHVMRSEAGLIVGLEHLPAWRVRPDWPIDSDKWITRYLVDVDGQEFPVLARDIIHFKDRKDPENERLGLSRIKAGKRLIASGNECETFTFKLMKNEGRLGVIVSPAHPEGEFTPETVEILKSKLNSRGGDGRLDPMVSDISAKIEHVGHSPEQMRLNELPANVQADICALIGPSPMVTGLAAAQFHSTYANSAAAARAAWNRIGAIQDRFAKTVRRQLLMLVDPDANAKRLDCRFNRSQVEALSEDRLLVAQEVAALFGTAKAPGSITRNEARERLGLQKEEPLWGDVYADGLGLGNRVGGIGEPPETDEDRDE